MTNQLCKSCEARLVCGGECFVVAFYKHNNISGIDSVMFRFKKHLFELAVRFKYELLLNDENLFYELAMFCSYKEKRFEGDKDLWERLNSDKNKYSFMELKKIKDDFPLEYELIKKNFA